MKNDAVLVSLHAPRRVALPLQLKLKQEIDRLLSTRVQTEHTILPAVDDSLVQLRKAKVFSKLDADSGYWQVPLAEKSKPPTTFITQFGRFYLNRLSFGITSAPAFF
ncbi:hypothetical protein PR048_004004 [Dryococelus australis]|uniref:Reverse transcriptase domain-containing protein n=1 Tax=Dryococelus australis TaxID=614101 RepID=A0ABQ9I486_9NEOP|nr:hypothetical protein PR048_004004 [Dryococelus australis]